MIMKLYQTVLARLLVEGKRRSHGSGECVMELSVGSG
jgi:hypothetical protein